MLGLKKPGQVTTIFSALNRLFKISKRLSKLIL
jgi:hypothetical protein